MHHVLGEILSEGARRMLATALEVEVEAYIRQIAHLLDADGRPWHKIAIRSIVMPMLSGSIAGQGYVQNT